MVNLASYITWSFSLSHTHSHSLAANLKEMGDLGDRGSEVPRWVKHPIFKALVVAGLVMGALSPVLLKVMACQNMVWYGRKRGGLKHETPCLRWPHEGFFFRHLPYIFLL